MYRFLATALLSMLLHGCVTNKSVATENVSVCIDAVVTESCVLAYIDQNLSLISDHIVWINAAVEYSYALRAYQQDQDSEKLLDLATLRAAKITDQAQQINALYEIAAALIDSKDLLRAKEVIAQAGLLINQADDSELKTDNLAKHSVLLIKAGEINKGLAQLGELSQDSDNEASFKARAFKDAAVYLAEKNQIEKAVDAITKVSYGLVYYQSIARIEIAKWATVYGSKEIAFALLNDAEKIARTQTDGYFLAGALRDNAEAYFIKFDKDKAITLFNEASLSALQGRTPQHRARAISRIATKMADIGLYQEASMLLPQALEQLASEGSERMRNYSLYEIAGSAAFSGDFNTAFENLELIPDEAFGSAQSLRNATKRDIAWGLARHGRFTDALEIADTVKTPREQIQLLSRVLRILKQPDMPAFPRYL